MFIGLLMLTASWGVSTENIIVNSLIKSLKLTKFYRSLRTVGSSATVGRFSSTVSVLVVNTP